MGRYLVIAAWATVVAVALAIFAARHSAPFQKPLNLELAAQDIASRSPSQSVWKWVAVHVLDPRCSCSDKVLSLLSQNKEDDVRHIVLLLSPASEALREQLQAQKVEIWQSSPEEARKLFHIETVPWFVLLDRQLQVKYSGGYAADKIRTASDVKLKEIINTIRSDKAVAALPSYGCVTSEELRKRLLMGSP